MRHLALGLAAVVSSSMVAVFAGCGGGDDATSPSDEAPASDASTASADASSGSSSGDSGSADAAPAATYTISANIVGLAGTGLVLEDAKSGTTVSVAPGTPKVTIASKVPAGTAFDVQVKTQPSAPPQSCVVTGGAGTVVAGNVESITVNCTTLYSVGGTVSGLAGQNLILANNGTADSVTVNANGQFAFPKLLASGAAYAVTVKQNPTNKWQTCTVTAGDAGAASGTIANANVSNIAVSCTTNAYAVSVKVAGLSGTGLVFQDKGADDLPVAANGTYAFATKVESGATYDVTVATQPTGPSQTCTVTNGKATMAGADVVLDVACVVNTYKVGGKLDGLQGNGLVLQDNAGDDLTLNAGNNGDFSFLTKIASGGSYAVTVKTQPTGVAGETCWVTSASGNVTSADVASVRVWCGTGRKVFVSSQLFGANLGGLDGADAKCQALADAANVKGVYRAWLSDSTGSPSTRFTQSTIPYKLVNGTSIASSWTDLTDGNLAASISVTETGGAPPASSGPSCAPDDVFSNTAVNGTTLSGTAHCTNWTGAGSSIQWGRSSQTTSTWTNYCSGGGTAFCDGTHKSKLYCFQQ